MRITFAEPPMTGLNEEITKLENQRAVLTARKECVEASIITECMRPDSVFDIHIIEDLREDLMSVCYTLGRLDAALDDMKQERTLMNTYASLLQDIYVCEYSMMEAAMCGRDGVYKNLLKDHDGIVSAMADIKQKLEVIRIRKMQRK